MDSRPKIWVPSVDAKVTWVPRFFDPGHEHGSLIVTSIDEEWTAVEVKRSNTGFDPGRK